MIGGSGAALALATVIAVGGLTACRREAPRKEARTNAPDASYINEIRQWRQKRDARLRRPDGWLSLAGLYWLEDGENTVGSAPTSDLVFPADKAPLELGVMERHGDTVTFEPTAGVQVLVDDQPVRHAVTMVPDTEEGTTVLQYGPLLFYAIVRGDRVGVRLKDSESEVLASFKGIESYPIDPKWRVVARFKPYDPPKLLHIPTILGDVDEEPAPGALEFAVGDQQFKLDVTQEGDEFFVVFGDSTNGKTTYGGGRFIYTSLPDPAGDVVLDFNKAYNPPCVFTPYATCPLPTPANKLPIAVTAGEKLYGHPDWQ
jgi:uncharacterized protein (DUF1684 family)